MYVALDDSKRKLVVAMLRPGATEPEEREIPKDAPHIQRLFQRLKREGPVQACYEAGVSGYDLYRQITACGVTVPGIAPALTQRSPGQRIKTDRRDARKLVRLFRAGELTPIHVPDEAEEAARDLVRCREAVRRDVVRWRHRLLKLLDRHGRLWVVEKNWTQRHWTWLRVQHFELAALQRAFEATVFALEQALARQAELDKEGEALAATAPYRDPVGWLRCFRGVGTLSAMVLLAEIVDLALPPAPGTHGLPGAGPQRVLLRRDPPAGCADESRQYARAPGPGRGRLALSAPPAGRPRAGEPAPGGGRGGRRAGVAGATAIASSLPPSRRPRQTPAGRRGRDRPRAGGLSVGGHDQTGNAPASRINRARARARREGLDFLKGVGVGAMWTRLESPRVCYATPGLPIGTTRASRRRQLPTNQCHAALPSPVIRVYQPDSSSTPSHRQPAADALGKSSAPSREFHGCRCRSRDRPRPDKPLDGRSFHISRAAQAGQNATSGLKAARPPRQRIEPERDEDYEDHPTRCLDQPTSHVLSCRSSNSVEIVADQISG